MPEIIVDKIIRSRRLTIGLQINPDGKLIVRAPYKAGTRQIQAFIEIKRNWILKHQARIANHKRLYQPPKFEAGERFYFLGVPYPLFVSESQRVPFYFNDGFHLDRHFQHQARELFTQWYLERAHEIIPSRVRHYSKLNNLHPKSIKIGQARRRWGSCGFNGSLNFSWRLALTPVDVIDYIVVHELAHLLEKNHSKRFWLRVTAMLPGYDSARKWLRQNSRASDF